MVSFLVVSFFLLVIFLLIAAKSSFCKPSGLSRERPSVVLGVEGFGGLMVSSSRPRVVVSSCSTFFAVVMTTLWAASDCDIDTEVSVKSSASSVVSTLNRVVSSRSSSNLVVSTRGSSVVVAKVDTTVVAVVVLVVVGVVTGDAVVLLALNLP